MRLCLIPVEIGFAESDIVVIDHSVDRHTIHLCNPGDFRNIAVAFGQKIQQIGLLKFGDPLFSGVFERKIRSQYIVVEFIIFLELFWQVFQPNEGLVVHSNESFDQGLKFVDIARPCIAHETGDGF